MFSGEDIRYSFSRFAAHVRDSFESKGSARDGHHDIVGSHHLQMTSRYTHAMPENLRAALDTLGQTNLGRVVRFKRKSATGSSDPSATADGTDFMMRELRVSIAPKSRQLATGTEGM